MLLLIVLFHLAAINIEARAIASLFHEHKKSANYLRSGAVIKSACRGQNVPIVSRADLTAKWTRGDETAREVILLGHYTAAFALPSEGSLIPTARRHRCARPATAAVC